MVDGAVRRRILVIHNPVAGARRPGRLERVLDATRAAGVQVELRLTSAPGDAERFAAQADPACHDAVVAAGGDGTINEVINGLMNREGTRIPLGLLPLGTANVLAVELGLPSAPEALAQVLAHGPVRRIHLGRANGRAFACMAGVGMDARVVAGVRPYMKRLAGKAAYVAVALAEIMAGSRVAFAVETEGPDGQTARHEAASCIIAKGRFYGGRFLMAPGADLGSPGFQVCLFRHGGRFATFAYAAGLVLGCLPRIAGFEQVPATRVRVMPLSGTGTDSPVQGDGDIIAHLPLLCDITPFSLPVLAPSAPGAEMLAA